jgi:hypothetical protein
MANCASSGRKSLFVAVRLSPVDALSQVVSIPEQANLARQDSISTYNPTKAGTQEGTQEGSQQGSQQGSQEEFLRTRLRGSPVLRRMGRPGGSQGHEAGVYRPGRGFFRTTHGVRSIRSYGTLLNGPMMELETLN